MRVLLNRAAKMLSAMLVYVQHADSCKKCIRGRKTFLLHDMLCDCGSQLRIEFVSAKRDWFDNPPRIRKPRSRKR